MDSCPFIYNTKNPDEPEYLLDWELDPEYFLFYGCQCSMVGPSVLMPGISLPGVISCLSSFFTEACYSVPTPPQGYVLTNMSTSTSVEFACILPDTAEASW